MKTSSQRARESEIRIAWESWELILYNKLETYVHLLDKIKADLSAAGLSKVKGDEFLHHQVTDMIEQIIENQSKKAVGA